jgi:hypothetical protein
MKKITNFLIILLVTMTAKSFAVIHIINYNPATINLLCNVGDTLRFTNNTTAQTIIGIRADTTTLFTSTGVVAGAYKDYPIPLTLAVGTHTYVMVISGNTFVTGSFIIQGPATSIYSVSKNEADIKVYPNPVLNELFISTPSEAVCIVYNSCGEVVLSATLQPGENKVDIDLLAPGLYYARIGNRTTRILRY